MHICSEGVADAYCSAYYPFITAHSACKFCLAASIWADEEDIAFHLATRRAQLHDTCKFPSFYNFIQVFFCNVKACADNFIKLSFRRRLSLKNKFPVPVLAANII